MPIQNKSLVIGIAVVILIGVFYLWYSKSGSSSREISGGATTIATSSAGKDLGTDLYEKANNPIAKKLPETATPVANPIEGMYKNPFE